jgi:ATP-dependent RNA helicase SUPV3L1/SUV3
MTLREDGMPALRAALAAPMAPLPCAHLSEGHINPRVLGEALPVGAPTSAFFAAMDHVLAPRAPYRVVEMRYRDDVVRLIDEKGGELDLSERLHLIRAPIQMRDPRVADGIGHFVRAYRAALHVRVRRALGPSGLLQHLASVVALMKNRHAEVTTATLGPLESLHKLLTIYIWLSYRNPVTWADMEDAMAIKEETEEAMTWCLSRLALTRHESYRRGSNQDILGLRRKSDRNPRSYRKESRDSFI